MSRPKPSDQERRRVVDAVATLGWSIRLWRRSIPLPQSDLAIIARISRTTLRSVEDGALGTSIGAYAAVLCAMGIESHLHKVAQPTDADGRRVTVDLPPDRARARRSAGRIQCWEHDW